MDKRPRLRSLLRLHGAHIKPLSGRVPKFIATISWRRQHTPKLRTLPTGLGSTKLAAADAGREKARIGQRQNEAVTLNVVIDDAPGDSTSHYTAPSPCVARPRVLVAEENADMRIYLGRILGNDGYQVLSVADGVAALAAAGQQKPDLVLTAVMLPRLDGIGLLAALRKDPHLRHVPAVVLLPSGSEAARAACLRAGADDYLVKPFSADELRTRVGSHLALSHRRAAEIAANSRLHALSCRLTAISDLPSLLHEVLLSAIELQGADFGSIQLYDLETRSLHIAAQHGLGAEFLEHFRTVIVDEGSACARALKDGTRVVIEDVTLDPEFAPHRRIAAAAGFRAVQLIPLIERGSGQAVGMLSTYFGHPHRPGAGDLRPADLYAIVAGEVIALRITEQRLRDSEACLQAAVDLVGLSFYSWNLQTGALTCNACIKATWGLPPEARVDHAILLAGIHPDDRPNVEAAVARTTDPAGDGLYQAEFRVVGSGDAPERWISAHGRTFFDNGRPVRHFGTMRDITDQKREEERARESEERLRASLAASGTGTWRWNVRTGATAPADRDPRPDGGVRRIQDTTLAVRDERGRMGRAGASASAQDITHYSGSLVYLVDADPTSCIEVAEMLRGAGYDVKTFSSARTFLQLAAVLVPGCVVVDIRAAEAGGLAIPRELKARRRELPVIIVGDTSSDPRLGVCAMKAGATDFLQTPYRRQDLLTAIATELADIQEVTARDREAELAKAGVAAMSTRERQVLDGIMLAGGTSKSIARDLGISPRTVEMHRAHVMERLGAKTLSELILLATAAGLRHSRIVREAGSDAVIPDSDTIFRKI